MEPVDSKKEDALKNCFSSSWEPGMIVRNPTRLDWGLGQVQSYIGHRITINFENTGKSVIDERHVTLEQVFL